MRGGAFFNGKEGRDDFRKTALRAVTSFLLRRKAWLEVELSLQERRRGRKVSTVGRFSSSSLRFLSPGNGGTEGGVKTIEEDRDEFHLQLAIINSYDILNY